MPNYRQSVAHNLLKERKVNIISEIPDRIKCVICKNVIFNARQSPCGCHYCYDCIENYLKDETKYCPGKTLYCQEEEINMKCNVVDDFSTDREIRRLRFRCQNVGCIYEDEVRLMDDHIQSCSYGEEQCELCGICLLRMDLNKHMNEECDNRIVTCQFCGSNIISKIMVQEHLNINSDNLCTKFVSICPLKCNVTDPIVICKHRSVCANRPRNCPYEVVGCPAQGFTKKELNGHIKDHIFDHSRILFAKLSQYKNDLNTIKEELYTFVWKIDKFSSLVDLSSATKNRCFSPQFKIGQFGYCAKMELYIADGSIQLYFSIVQGDYDDILRWPFDKNVSISIMDQSGGEKHHTKVLKTSLEPNCFMKISDGRKKGLGWEKFIELNSLESLPHLWQNDRLFIKCTVDI